MRFRIILLGLIAWNWGGAVFLEPETKYVTKLILKPDGTSDFMLKSSNNPARLMWIAFTGFRQAQ